MKKKISLILGAVLLSSACLTSCSGDTQPESDCYTISVQNDYGSKNADPVKPGFTGKKIKEVDPTAYKAKFTLNDKSTNVLKFKKGSDCDVTIKFDSKFIKMDLEDNAPSIEIVGTTFGSKSQTLDPQFYTLKKVDADDPTVYKLHIDEQYFKNSLQLRFTCGYLKLDDLGMNDLFVLPNWLSPEYFSDYLYYKDNHNLETVNPYVTSDLEFAFIPDTYKVGSTYTEEVLQRLQFHGISFDEETYEPKITKLDDNVVRTNLINQYAAPLGNDYGYVVNAKGLDLKISPSEIFTYNKTKGEYEVKYNNILVSLKDATARKDEYLPTVYSYSDKIIFEDGETSTVKGGFKVEEYTLTENENNELILNIKLTAKDSHHFYFDESSGSSYGNLDSLTITSADNGITPYFRSIKAKSNAAKGELSLNDALYGTDKRFTEGTPYFENGNHCVIPFAYGGEYSWLSLEGKSDILSITINLPKFIALTQLDDLTKITEKTYLDSGYNTNCGSLDFLESFKIGIKMAD